MVKRNIVKIDEQKCNGCGLCVDACAEGAIKIINGKAKLISDIYCDGLGACIGHCPEDAITIEQRQADEFDEQATKEHLSEENKKTSETADFVCPGMMAAQLRDKDELNVQTKISGATSRLTHWPVQLKLVSPKAPYFDNADLPKDYACIL